MLYYTGEGTDEEEDYEEEEDEDDEEEDGDSDTNAAGGKNQEQCKQQWGLVIRTIESRWYFFLSWFPFCDRFILL